MSERDDIELQKYLSGDSDVSRQYRDLPQGEPSPELDATILAAARDEAQRPVRPTWMVPVSVAATVVLGVGLSMQLQRSEQAPAVYPIPESVDRSVAQVAAEPATPIDDDPVAQPTDGPAPEAEAVIAERASDASSEAVREVLGQLMTSPEPAADLAPPPPQPAPMPSAPPRPAASITADTAPADARADEGSQRSAEARERFAMDLDERQAAQEGMGEAAEREELAGLPTRAQAKTLPPESAPPSARRAGASAEPDLAAFAVDTAAPAARSAFVPESDDAAIEELPERRLREIRRLWEAGEKDRAREQLAAFRDAFPDYVIPESFPVKLPTKVDHDTPASPPSE